MKSAAAVSRQNNSIGIGRRVRIRRTKSMRAWCFAGQYGEIIGGDPRGTNPYVVSVKLDSGLSVLEVQGVHVSNIEVIPLDNK